MMQTIKKINLLIFNRGTSNYFEKQDIGIKKVGFNLKSYPHVFKLRELAYGNESINDRDLIFASKKKLVKFE